MYANSQQSSMDIRKTMFLKKWKMRRYFIDEIKRSQDFVVKVLRATHDDAVFSTAAKIVRLKEIWFDGKSISRLETWKLKCVVELIGRMKKQLDDEAERILENEIAEKIENMSL